MLLDCVHQLQASKEKMLVSKINHLLPVTEATLVQGQPIRSVLNEVGNFPLLLDESDMRFLQTSAKKVGGQSLENFTRLVGLLASVPVLWTAWSKLLGYVGPQPERKLSDACPMENKSMQKEIYAAAKTIRDIGQLWKDLYPQSTAFNTESKNLAIAQVQSEAKTSKQVLERNEQSDARREFYSSIVTRFQKETQLMDRLLHQRAAELKALEKKVAAYQQAENAQVQILDKQVTECQQMNRNLKQVIENTEHRLKSAREVAQREKKAATNELKAANSKLKAVQEGAQQEKQTAADALATVQRELENTQNEMKKAVQKAQAETAVQREALNKQISQMRTQAEETLNIQRKQLQNQVNQAIQEAQVAKAVQEEQAAACETKLSQIRTQSENAVNMQQKQLENQANEAIQKAQQMVKTAQTAQQAAQRETEEVRRKASAELEQASATLDEQRAQQTEAFQKVQALQQDLSKRTEENAMYRTSMEQIGNNFFKAGFIKNNMQMAEFIDPNTGILGEVLQTLIALNNATANLKEILQKEVILPDWKDANLMQLLDPASGPISFLIQERKTCLDQVNTAKQILYKAVLPLVVPRGTSFPELQNVSLVEMVNELSLQLSELLNRIQEQVRDLAPGESKLTFTSIPDGLREWTVLLRRELATLLGQESVSALFPNETTVGGLIKKLLARITEIGKGVNVDGPDDILPEIKAIRTSIDRMGEKLNISLNLPDQRPSTILNGIFNNIIQNFESFNAQFRDSNTQLTHCMEKKTASLNEIRRLTNELEQCLTHMQKMSHEQNMWQGMSRPLTREHKQSIKLPDPLDLRFGDTATQYQSYLVSEMQPAVNNLITALRQKHRTVPNNTALKAITLIQEAINIAQSSQEVNLQRLYGLVEQLTKMQTNIFK